MQKLFPFVFFASLLLLASCRTIKPQSPEITISSRTLPMQETSSIYIPLRINLEPIFAKVEKDAPKKLTGAENQCEGVSFSYVFERNPIQFAGKKDLLSFTVDGKYALKVNYCPKCTDFYQTTATNCVIPRVYLSCGVGEPMRRIRLGFETKLNVSNDFRIQSKTNLDFVKAIDPCEVSFVNYDATEEVLKEVEKSLKDLAKDLDKQIQATEVRKEVDAAWKLLSKPIALGEYGFLAIQPQKIFISEPNFSNKSLFMNVGLEALPIVTSVKPIAQGTGLPPLSKEDREHVFSINLDVMSSYDSLNQMLRKNISNLEFDFKGRTFHIDQVSVFGASNDKLQFVIDFSGSKSGKLYLIGTPFFNNEEATIYFKDVDFDVQTKDVLIKSAKWLFNDRICRLIEEKAMYCIQNELNDIKKKLNFEINKQITNDVRLEGELKHVNVIHILPTENQLVVRVALNGFLKAHVF